MQQLDFQEIILTAIAVFFYCIHSRTKLVLLLQVHVFKTSFAAFLYLQRNPFFQIQKVGLAFKKLQSTGSVLNNPNDVFVGIKWTLTIPLKSWRELIEMKKREIDAGKKVQKIKQ